MEKQVLLYSGATIKSFYFFSQQFRGNSFQTQKVCDALCLSSAHKPHFSCWAATHHFLLKRPRSNTSVGTSLPPPFDVHASESMYSPRTLTQSTLVEIGPEDGSAHHDSKEEKKISMIHAHMIWRTCLESKADTCIFEKKRRTSQNVLAMEESKCKYSSATYPPASSACDGCVLFRLAPWNAEPQCCSTNVQTTWLRARQCSLPF